MSTRTARSVGETILVALVALVGCASALTLLPPWHPFLEWNSTQIPLYLMLLMVGLPLILLCSTERCRSVRAILIVLSVLFIGRFVALHTEFFFAEKEEGSALEQGALKLSLLTIKIDTEAERFAAQALLSSEYDLIAVRGVEAVAFARAVEVENAGRFAVVSGDRVALLSRFPVDDTAHASLGEDASPGLVTTVRPSGSSDILIAVLSLPPLTNTESATRNRRAMRRVATLARHATGPAIVVGDIGARATSHTYSFLTVGSGMRDGAWGRGGRIEGDRYPLLRLFAFDHLFVKGSSVRSLLALPWNKSGVQPLRAELRIFGAAK